MALDRAAFRTFFERYGPMVRRRARQILGNDADADEALQEVFIRALKGHAAFEGKSSPSTWLYRITTNWCLNKIRDAKRRRELWDEKVEPGLSTSVTQPSHHQLQFLRLALQRADEAEAAAAIYVHIDGLSHAEAAKLLGVSRRTVGNLLIRFAEGARALLAEQAPGTLVEPE